MEEIFIFFFNQKIKAVLFDTIGLWETVTDQHKPAIEKIFFEVILDLFLGIVFFYQAKRSMTKSTKNVQSTQAKILNKLASLSPYKISAMSEDAHFERGKNYFHHNALQKFSWKNDGSALECLVEGTQLYRVVLSLSRYDDVIGQCSCPVRDTWGDELCKHEICALLTASFLLKGGAFGPREKKLLQQLRGTLPVAVTSEDYNLTDYSVHLFKHKMFTGALVGFDFYLRGEVFYKGKEIPSESVIPIPKILMSVKGAIPAADVLRSLDDIFGTVQIFVHQGDASYLVASKEFFMIEPKLAFDLSSQKTLSITMLQGPSFAPFQALFLVTPELLFDPALGVFGFFKDKCTVENTSWEYPYREIINSASAPGGDHSFIEFSSDKSIVFDEAFFLEKALIEERQNISFFENCLFKKDGQLVEPTQRSIEYAVEATATQDPLLLELTIKAKPNVIHFTTCPVVNFTDELIACLPSRSKAIRHFFYQEVTNFFDHPASMDYEKFTKLMVKKCREHGIPFNNVLQKKLRNSLEKISQAVMLQGRVIIIENNNFFVYTYSIADFAKLFFACVKVGVLSFDKKDGSSFLSMLVKEQEVTKNLLTFKTALEEYGVALSFEGKKVQAAKLDFSIIVEQGSDIDWFQIKPEILLEGVKLPFAEWEKILEQHGSWQHNNAYNIFDEASLTLLKRVASYAEKKDGTQAAERSKRREIFEIPRLQIFDLFEMKQMGARLTLPEKDEQLINSLFSLASLPSYPIPQKFVGELRDYQKIGYDWLAFLYEHRFGGCLADDMGLGKTIQAIAFLAGLDDGVIKKRIQQQYPHLIVVPPSLLFNWQHEFSLFYPSCRVLIHHGAVRNLDFTDVDVVLTTYDMMRSDAQALADKKFHAVIFDEAQSIKNIYAKRTKAVRQLHGVFKLCLTGTPLENHAGEFYSIMDLAVPGLFPDYKNFQKSVKGERAGLLIRRSKPFLLRRTKQEILQDLPPKIESDVYLEMQEKQKSLYARTVAQIKNIVLDAYESKTAAQAGIVALTAILRLRQICITGELLDKNIDEPSPKIDYLIKKLQELAQEGHAALIFSQFTSALDLLEKYFKKAEVSYVRIDGSMSVVQRKNSVKAFQHDATASVMLLSLKAGGVGLNLTRASYVFHLDPWWNPAVENQASDRAHRIGQQQQVMVTRLVMHDSIEEKMMVLKARKAQLFEAILSASTADEHGSSSIISREDFEFLLS